jgi:hypothetical protein
MLFLRNFYPSQKSSKLVFPVLLLGCIGEKQGSLPANQCRLYFSKMPSSLLFQIKAIQLADLAHLHCPCVLATQHFIGELEKIRRVFVAGIDEHRAIGIV